MRAFNVDHLMVGSELVEGQQQRGALRPTGGAGHSFFSDAVGPRKVNLKAQWNVGKWGGPMLAGGSAFASAGRVDHLCAIRAREAEPSGGPNPARALDRGAGRFLFDLIEGSERWGGGGRGARARSHGAWIAPGALPE